MHPTHDQKVTIFIVGRGIYPPNNHGAIPLNSHIPPFFLPPLPPQTIFGHCICNFVQFMRVFGEFWKLSVGDNDPQKTK